MSLGEVTSPRPQLVHGDVAVIGSIEQSENHPGCGRKSVYVPVEFQFGVTIVRRTDRSIMQPSKNSTHASHAGMCMRSQLSFLKQGSTAMLAPNPELISISPT